MKIAVLGLALCAAISASAQDKPADFASQTPLTLSGEGPWYRIELPLAVQLNARQADLGDVRVFNAEGSRRPTRSRRVSLRASRSPRPSRSNGLRFTALRKQATPCQ